MDHQPDYRFDPVDGEQIRLTAQLTVGQRIQRLLDGRELAVGLIRGRLRRRYPDMPSRELNLKLVEELERAQRRGRGT